MKLKPLGNTGLNVSAVALGTGPLGELFAPVSPSDATRIVHEAIDLGITFIDTAPAYGSAEERLGHALRGRRDDVVLATKAGRVGPTEFDFSAEGIRRSLERSLIRLQTDHVDVFQLHDIEFVPFEGVVTEAFDELRRLRERGLCRAIGLTGYPIPLMSRAMRELEPDVVLSYAHGTLLDSSITTELLPIAQERGVGLINAAAVALGLLTPRGSGFGDGHPATPEIRAAADAMRALCAERGREIGEVANQYAIQRSGCATTLVGTATSRHLHAAVAAVDSAIDEELLAELIALRPERPHWPSGIDASNAAVSAR